MPFWFVNSTCNVLYLWNVFGLLTYKDVITICLENNLINFKSSEILVRLQLVRRFILHVEFAYDIITKLLSMPKS